MLFRRKRQHNVVLYCLFPPCFTVPVFSRSRRFFPPCSRFSVRRAKRDGGFFMSRTKSALFPSRKKPFSVFPFPKKTAKKAPSGCKNQPSHARIVGFCQFQNLSIGEMHKVFLRSSGASALNFHAQKSSEKNFVSKEPRKSAFLHRRFRSCSAEKTCAMLVLPSGEAPNRTERRHDEQNDVERG